MCCTTEGVAVAVKFSRLWAKRLAGEVFEIWADIEGRDNFQMQNYKFLRNWQNLSMKQAEVCDFIVQVGKNPSKADRSCGFFDCICIFFLFFRYKCILLQYRTILYNTLIHQTMLP